MNPVAFPAMKRPLIAILRGLKPEEAEGVVGVLIESGMTAIEIPLNSPDPFRSIEIAVKKASSEVLIGAGTVLTPQAVERLHDVGGRLMVTPNVDPEVIASARERGMVTMPGVFTATEALLAAKAGASGLKFFPASVLGASGISAIRAVLPADLMIAAVGGIALALVTRLISVAVPVTLIHLRQLPRARGIAVLTWGGLRGGISVALAPKTTPRAE